MSHTTRLRSYDLGKRAEGMQATRRRIAEAAMDLHGSVGPARTTVSAVAELAGVRRNTLYRHFPTEEDLYAACSGHFWSLHPLPGPSEWQHVEEPRARFTAALTAMYAYYGETTDMLANLTRDAEVMPVVERSLQEYTALLDGIAREAGDDQTARATARHALDFATWRSLVHRGGLADDLTVELMASLVFGDAGRHGGRDEPTGGGLQQSKRHAIVRAAFEAFAEHGFRASLDEIAERARVSKVTIYSHFSDKEELFRTVITEQLDEAVGAARRLRKPLPGNHSLETELRALCSACIGVLSSPVMIRLQSVLEAEAKRFPEDIGPWLDLVPAELRLVLDDTLRALPGTAGIRIPDPDIAVSQLYALCVQPGTGRPTPERNEDVVESGLAMFLKYYEDR
ncbi:TetR/AcrR family transcriptional regulator [Pseudonocardia sp. CA-142604]|uniref:TetR/AcrR family transcriptional regulator n=1 Tax=Pseudonocardia sp. CA-142604 TaxID=3240024 RepID=UPI003D8AFA4F